MLIVHMVGLFLEGRGVVQEHVSKPNASVPAGETIFLFGCYVRSIVIH
jgi:hypothetical protein